MKKAAILGVILIIIVIGVYFRRSKADKNADGFIVASKGQLTQEVSATGRIKSAQDIKLAFERGGQVAHIYVKIGDYIKAGQKLVNLNNSELSAQLSQANANVKIQKAKLDELKRGTRPEEIQIYEVKIENARISLEDARKNIVDKLQDAFTKSDDAIRNKTDQFFKNPQTQTPKLIFDIANQQSQIDIEFGRLSAEYDLKLWENSLNKLTTDSDLGEFVSAAKNNLYKIKNLLDKISLEINNPVNYPVSIPQNTFNNWKIDISTARANINAAVNNLSAAEEKLRNVESGLILSENELNLKLSGTPKEQIHGQEAQVEQAQANVLNIQAQISKTILHSPINGIVSKIDIKTGEIAAPNTPVAAIISSGNYQIEANIPETDIAKIKIGNNAKITVDAYGDDIVFPAKIVKIEPAGTIIEGIATYKTILQFIKNDKRIKPEMTTNIKIITAERKNVISVPRKAIISDNNEKFVEIFDANAKNLAKRIKIKTGITGSDGTIEVVSGLKEGNKIILPKNNSGK